MDGQYRDHSAERLSQIRKELSNLYNAEETYWAQRSRIRWLREGDRNTCSFHVRASYRARKNHIERLEDADGCWLTSEELISKVARKYFVDLFATNCDNNVKQVLAHIPICVTDDMNRTLMEPVSNREIRDALNQMDPRKALGSDGLSSLFFKEH